MHAVGNNVVRGLSSVALATAQPCTLRCGDALLSTIIACSPVVHTMQWLQMDMYSCSCAGKLFC